MEKVLPADRYSGVAIAGAAGPAMEMVKLFQLQLEHYEKVEGTPLSLEGKANQLSMMVRGNLPAAMQGMVVVPIFAGYDTARGTGPPVHLRRHRRPLRGARLRRHRLGQPARRHGHQGRLPRRPEPRRGRRPVRARRCGRRPTPTRPPAAPTRCAASTRSWPPSPPPGFERVDRRRARAAASRPWRGDAAVTGASSSSGGRAMSMPFYVAPEQVMKDRADYARKGIARGRGLVAVVYDDGIVIVAENPSQHAAQGERDLRPHRLRRRRQVQRVRPAAGGRRAGRRPQGLPVQPRRRRRPQPGQPVRPDPRPGLHPRDEADGGRDPGRRGRRTTPGDDQLFHILYDGTVIDEQHFSVLGGDADAIAQRARGGAGPSGLDLADALAGRGRRAGRPRPHAERRRPRGRRARPQQRPACLPPPRRRRGRPRCSPAAEPPADRTAAGGRAAVRRSTSRGGSARPPPAPARPSTAARRRRRCAGAASRPRAASQVVESSGHRRSASSGAVDAASLAPREVGLGARRRGPGPIGYGPSTPPRSSQRMPSAPSRATSDPGLELVEPS